MTLAALGRRSERLSLTNLVTEEVLAVAAHPGTIGWALAVGWAHLEVPGRLGQPVQYAGTQNTVLAPLELTFDRRLPVHQGGTRDLSHVQRFLSALTAPAPGHRAPPPALLVWPAVLQVEVLVTSLAFEHRELAHAGGPLVLVATLGLEASPASQRRRAW